MKNIEMKKRSLASLGNFFKWATIIVGIIAAIDIIIPDPIFGLDEAALLSLTALFETCNVIVANKINELDKYGKTKYNQQEVVEIANKIKNVKTNVKKH